MLVTLSTRIDTVTMTNIFALSQPRPKISLGLLGITIALSPPVVQVFLWPWLHSTFPFPLDRFMSLGPFWFALVVALGIAYFGEGYPLSRFGFRMTNKSLRARLIEWILTLLAALFTAIAIFAVSGVLRNLVTDEPIVMPALVSILPYWVLIPAWITSAFVEEVLFRSYAIERLTDFTGRRWLAGLIAMTSFTVLHLLSWDWIHVLTLVFPGSLALTLLYLWRRNLAFVVIIHAIMNAPLLLMPLLAPYM